MVISPFAKIAKKSPDAAAAEIWEFLQQAKAKKVNYIFEPDQQQLLETLVPSILQLSFHKSVLDTQASEHGSRMTAMDKATENAEELLKGLKIFYNKKRQEAITTELGEIVSGAAALES